MHDQEIDGLDDGTDPSLGLAVARCTTSLDEAGVVRVKVANGYPGYTCRLWTVVENRGEQPLGCGATRIRSSRDLVVETAAWPPCGVLDVGERQTLRFTIRVVETADEGKIYRFQIEQRFTLAP